MMKNFIEPVLVVTAVLGSLIGAEVVIYAQVGQDVVLMTQENTQGNYVQWYFADVKLAWINPQGGSGVSTVQPWENRVSLYGHSLKIKNMTDKLFGTFNCKVFLRTVDTAFITIYKLIKLSVTKPDSPLLPGESLSLGCDVEDPEGRSKPDIYWLNPQNERVKDHQQTLNLKAESRYNGLWTCVIGEEQKVKIDIPVIDLAPGPERLYTSANSRLTVPCSIPSHISWKQIKQKGIREVQWHFSPKPSSSPTSDERQRLFFLSLEGPVTWQKDHDKGLQTVSDPTKGNLSLSRNQGREEDWGDYICSMTFENGATVERTVHVQVLQMTSSAGTQIVSGQSFNLSCSTGEPLPPDVRLRWIPPQKASALESDRHASHAAVGAAGAGDGGAWRCELWRGDSRLTSAVLMLKIEPKVSGWILVASCSAAVIFIVLIVVLVFVLHRRRQRKVRHVRHRLCQCKHPKPKGFYRT